MDGLSTAAVLIQLLGVSGACAKTLRTLIHTTKNAPEESIVWSDHSGVPEPDFNRSISNQLNTAKAKLGDLQSLVNELCTVLPNGSMKFQRMAWLRKKSFALGLQQDLINIKETLNLILDAKNAFSSVRIKLSLQRVEAQFGTTLRMPSPPRPPLDQFSPEAQRRELEDGDIQSSTESVTGFVTPEIQQSGADYPANLSPMALTILRNATTAAESPLGSDDPDVSFCQTIRQIGQFASLTFHVHRIVRCRGSCTCSCHHRSQFQSPRFLNRFLGTLFIGYAGLPGWVKACDQRDCFNQYSRTLEVSYSFPQWFMSQTFDLVAAMTYSGGPSFGIKVRNRVRPTDNSIFSLARSGDVPGIMEVFKRREATIDDLVYHTGQTILQVALELGHIEACKFLINLGLSPYITDDLQGSAAMEISKRILQNSDLRRGREMERAFTDIAPAHSEIWDFSHVHKVVVGILHTDLQQTLRDPIYHAQLNSLDCQGRTPLHWAALRGDEQTVKTLLLAGAVPDIVGQQIRSPLHYAIESGSIVCVERLLIAGCSVNRRDMEGHDSLHVAAWAQDMPAMLETIYLAGAALEGKDDTGCTALGCAANLNHPRNIEFLLSVGADIECRDKDGGSPLLETVRYSNCEALQVLLDHGARVDCTNNLGQTVLHLAAAYGNLKVVQLLRRRRLFGLNGIEKDSKGRTFMDMLAERANSPEGLAEALGDLIDNINDIQRGHGNVNNDGENETFADAVEYLEI